MIQSKNWREHVIQPGNWSRARVMLSGNWRVARDTVWELEGCKQVTHHKT